MTDWMIWFGLAGALVILEMFSGSFYLLMIAIALAAGGVAALGGVGGALQLAVAAVIGIVATYGLQRSKLGRRSKSDVMRDPNINLDIGQTLVIDAWNRETRSTRAMYRGALWDVELEKGADARPGTFIIREVQGSRLIVANSNLNNE